MLGNVATVGHGGSPVNITHFNVATTLDVQANVDGRDLELAAAAEYALRGLTLYV